MNRSKNQLFSKFLSLESTYDLYRREINGLSYWEYVRGAIWKDISRKTVNGIQKQDKSDDHLTAASRTLGRMALNLIRRNPFFARSSDILILGHPRRKLLKDGHWWDIYTDPIFHNLNHSKVHLELPHLFSHKEPARTRERDLFHLDFLNFLPNLFRRTGCSDPDISEDEAKFLKQIESEITKTFGISSNVKERVWKRLSAHQVLKPYLYRLLKRISPRFVVVVVSYGNFNSHLIEQAKKMNIPVIELQHGIIHERHPGYNHPNADSTLDSFPDYLFSFGEFWAKQVKLPIASERVKPVGYPFLDMMKSRYANVSGKDQLLFISQGHITRNLSKIAVEISDTIESRIVYKLHPDEIERYREGYEWLKNSQVKVVSDPAVSLYRLFAESRCQVGYTSTAIFEGMMFDLDTYLWDGPGLDIMNPLVKEGSAKKFDDAADLLNMLESPEGFKQPDTEYFFKNNAIQNIKSALSNFLRT